MQAGPGMTPPPGVFRGLGITPGRVPGKEHHGVMSYEDLPADIRSIPLSDTVIQADVIDLVLGPEDRRHGGLAVMVCDRDDRGVQPIVLTDLPEGAPAARLVEVLELLLPVVAQTGGAVLLGRGRRRGLSPTDRDRAWHQAALDACAAHRVRLLGFHLASPEGVRALPEPLAPAAAASA